ncbi:hypothetical protein S40285_07275 [Stachybotrys chlorohalonatus IBT 40285]|uniref:NAD(P)-binding domain-containing protein n=1 Tax=Stachybotrys chlorohalonatus (strain IBT 40285) TaxID=1283841 RepID=A0A084R010_STAC4|nr:hypothetical protein S40285_07275 [Stachybotrys chlorohalonata IBT 40285]
MRIIVGGSTGMVGTEIIRQALSHPDVSTVLALGRREVSAPSDLGPNADVSKLKSVVLKDFENYTDDVKSQLQGADAVIWTIGISPAKLKSMSWEQACKISRDYAIAGIQNISPLPRDNTKPLRFIYMSGTKAERDQTKKPLLLREYCLMRGDAESRILEYAQHSNGMVEACIAKAGIIQDPKVGAMTKMGHVVIQTISGLGKITVPTISAALLNQAVYGFEKETIHNEDMNRLGQKALALYK